MASALDVRQKVLEDFSIEDIMNLSRVSQIKQMMNKNIVIGNFDTTEEQSDWEAKSGDDREFIDYRDFSRGNP
jgi:hypothetical protein